MATNYWTNAATEPKRQFKWTLTLGSLDTQIPGWVIKSTSKPSFNMTEASHAYLNHTFYYPGKLTWNALEIALVDPGSPNNDTTNAMMNAIRKMGYAYPNETANGMENAQVTFSKAAATSILGDVVLRQISPNPEQLGQNLVTEQWTLKQAWIKDVNFGSLNYDNDGLVDLSMTLRYDWAIHTPGKSNGGIPGIF